MAPHWGSWNCCQGAGVSGAQADLQSLCKAYSYVFSGKEETAFLPAPDLTTLQSTVLDSAQLTNCFP